VQATTVGAIAGSVSAAIGAISATIAAISARNSRKSAQASEAALQETRRQREVDNARAELAVLGSVYDDALALVNALAVDRTSDPVAVERAREAVRRSMMLAGLRTPALERLVESQTPLRTADVKTIRAEITVRSAALRAQLTGVFGVDPYQQTETDSVTDGA
jgi:hypothetical protein